MKIKTLRGMGFDGKHTPAGSIVDVTFTLGKELIGAGRAVEVSDDAEAEVVSKTEGAKPFQEGDVKAPEGDDKPEEPAKPTKSNKSGK